MEPKDSTGQEIEQSLILEKYDIPFVSTRCHISFMSQPNTVIDQYSREHNGLPMTNEDKSIFQEEIANIFEKHDHEYNPSLLTWDKETGTNLRNIYTGYNGRWLELDFQNLSYTNKRLAEHNLDHFQDGIFFLECFASYLRHAANIEIPHISTKVIGETQHTETFSTNNLSYSFTLPCDTEPKELEGYILWYQRDINTSSKTTHSLRLEKDGVYMGRKKYVDLQIDKDGNRKFFAKDTKNVTLVVKLFELLSVYQRYKPYIDDPHPHL